MVTGTQNIYISVPGSAPILTLQTFEKSSFVLNNLIDLTTIEQFQFIMRNALRIFKLEESVHKMLLWRVIKQPSSVT